MSEIKTINFKRSDFMAKPPTILSKFLPFLLIVSFGLVSLYSVVTETGPDFNYFVQYGMTIEFAIVSNLLFMALVQYLVYWIFVWLYKSILKTRPYFAFVGERTFQDTFGIWYVAKNLVLGLVLFTQFWAPYLASFYSILNIILSYLVVLLTYTTLKKRVDIVFRPMIFKAMFYPWFVWQALGVLLTLLFGGVLL